MRAVIIGKLAWISAAMLLPAVVVQARLSFPWPFSDEAKAPVLVVGRVVSVRNDGRDEAASAKASSGNVKRDIIAMSAEVEVLRSYTHGGETIAANRIRVRFLDEPAAGFDAAPRLFEPGQVVAIPLQENARPESLWRLTADSGIDLLIPVAASLKEDETPPATARLFLLREIANSLGRGTQSEAVRTGGYLARQDGLPGDQGMAAELMTFLEPMIGADRQGWANVLTDLLAGKGIPRPTVADLFSNNIRPQQESMILARAALGKLGQSPATNALLIRTWIGNAPAEAWGAAGSLAEYATNPVTTETLRAALRNDVAGSAQIALSVARNGNRDILADALARALRVADRPAEGVSELQSAGMLLGEFGSEQDLRRAVELVRKYQTLDRNWYSEMWQTVGMSKGGSRVLAVVLRDRDSVGGNNPDNLRVCDFALEDLERLTGQKFGVGDSAIARAQAWLRSQGIDE